MMKRQGLLGMVSAVVLAGAVLACVAGCQQGTKLGDAVRARRAARTAEAQPPVFDSAAGEVELTQPATVQPTLRAHPTVSAIPKEVTATQPTREHPSGSAISKEVEPTPPSGGSVGQSASNPYRNSGAKEWEGLSRHNGKLVKWRSVDVRGRQVEIEGIPAPPVRSILFHWGDGTATSRMMPVRHTYGRDGWHRIDIVIEDILGRRFRDGTTIEIRTDAGGATPQSSSSGPAPSDGGTAQGTSGP